MYHDTSAPEIVGAIERALRVLDRNTATFADGFPDDTTAGNVYALRRARGSFPAGGNFGWTTGFWPGMLWLGYELTGAPRYRQLGERLVTSFADRLVAKVDIDHHDLGFLYTLACVAPWRLLGLPAARDTALAAARHLMTRYWPKAGVIQSWGDVADPASQGQTIVDSLMNMPLLYWAGEVTGERQFAEAAHSHALKLGRHSVRPDSSTFHTFYFDVETGAPRFGRTAQGFADDSCWARGQAWAIYGFALNYRATGDGQLLAAAQRVADYFLEHLPSDGVAYWDLCFGEGSEEERDSSAAAIAACGLRELAGLLPPGPEHERYAAAASAILASLAERYTSRDLPHSNALLLHGVYNKPRQHGVDEGNLWGDYFYLEALVRAARPGWRPSW